MTVVDKAGAARPESYFIFNVVGRIDDYAEKIRAGALALARERYLLEQDIDRVVEAALEHYRAAVTGTPA